MRVKSRAQRTGLICLLLFVVTEAAWAWAASLSERYTGQTQARTVGMTYDASQRLDVERIDEADGTSWQVSDYEYDEVGNRTTYTKTKQTGAPTVCTYEHNDWNQLVSFARTGSDPATVSYTYDDAGNRETRTKAGQTDNYTWDHYGRLKSIAHAATAKTYQYEYDYRSRRVSRLEGSELTLCAYSGGTSVTELKLAVNGTESLPGSTAGLYKLSKTFIRGSDMGGGVGGLIYSLKQTASPTQPAVELSTSAAGAVNGTWANLPNSQHADPRFNHYNGRGDVAAQVDDGGNLTWRGGYEAWGTRTIEIGTNEDRQRANTKEEDPTGLLNEGMRYRDLETGTWLSRDPAGFVDGPNLYAYVRQNPWSKFDPDGLFLSYLYDKLDQHVLQPVGNAIGEGVYSAMSSVMGSDTAAAVGNSRAMGVATSVVSGVKAASTTAMDVLVPGSSTAGALEKVAAGEGSLGEVASAAVDDFAGKKVQKAVEVGKATMAVASGDLAGAAGELAGAAGGKALEKAGEVAGAAASKLKKNSSTGAGNQGLPQSAKESSAETGASTGGRKAVADMSRDERVSYFEGKGIPRSELGPSGYPKEHTVEHPNRKSAKDAARAEGQSKPEHHAHDEGQKPHYHATDGEGDKKSGGGKGAHHSYSKKHQ